MTSVSLNYKKIESQNDANTFIILHGLFGSLKNWITNGQKLSELGTVYLLDIRNHGESPHTETHTLSDLADDLKLFIDTHEIHKPILIGHSMGGLAVYELCARYPNLIDKLVIVDVVPKKYNISFEKEFEALQMNVSNYKSRQELDRDMSKLIPDPFLRQYLQMNLEKLETGYRWKINVATLLKSKDEISNTKTTNVSIENECLFIYGEKSNFVTQSDLFIIQSIFKNSKIHCVNGAEHYLHYTHSKEFLDAVCDWV